MDGKPPPPEVGPAWIRLAPPVPEPSGWRVKYRGRPKRRRLGIRRHNVPRVP